MLKVDTMIIVSLATYPARIPKLHKTIHTILGLTAKFDKLFINIPDNLTENDYLEYEKFKAYDNRIEIHKRDYRWRSANKYIWTYKDYPDAVIITCDDDLMYKSTYFLDLIDEHNKHPECIICHEINPMVVVGDRIKIINDVDLKLKQQEFGKYMTGCCLFPSHCLDGTDVFNFDLFMKMTNACHDEIWLWILTTLKKIKCIGLNRTWSFELDGCALPSEDTALSKINCNPINIAKYENLINQEYGLQLIQVLTTELCIFDVSTDNFLSIFGNLEWLHRLYSTVPIQFNIIDLPKSELRYLISMLNRYKWNSVEVKLNDN